YTVFIHVLDKQGNLVAQQDSMPQAGGWPTTCWRPDEIVTDRHSLTVTSGNYELVMGLYWFETGERLPPLTDSPEALSDGRLRLGSLTLE
ncbi:MAG: hypothetical protein KDE51_04760, partial [Anaerolineales bacterium]|nr:hypothetical protein [Anaerolineales bacterium]